jgi:hypothetical protein
VHEVAGIQRHPRRARRQRLEAEQARIAAWLRWDVERPHGPHLSYTTRQRLIGAEQALLWALCRRSWRSPSLAAVDTPWLTLRWVAVRGGVARLMVEEGEEIREG